MAEFTIDGTPYDVEPFTVQEIRLDNPEQRSSGAMSTVVTSAGERIFARRIPQITNPDLTEGEAATLEALLLSGEVDIAGDALGETITVQPEEVSREPYGADEVEWAVVWTAEEV